jgi:hypothetical protein
MTDPVKHQRFVRPGEVELMIKHLPGCGCDLSTSDPEATLVQLGCVTGYLVTETPNRPRP